MRPSVGFNARRKRVRKIKDSFHAALLHNPCPASSHRSPRPVRLQTLHSHHHTEQLVILGIWHIHKAFRLLFATRSATDPLEGEVRACSSGARMETQAIKDLFLVLTPKVRKTTLSCLLEGKRNPSFWYI